MKLTDKAREDFEKWYILKSKIGILLSEFYDLPQSMRYGVFIDWFDDLSKREDIICRICILIMETQKGFAYTINGSISDTYIDRTEARTKAIEKANEIYNSK